MAAFLMYESSCWLNLPTGVFTINWIWLFLIASMMLGRPSCTFWTCCAFMPFSVKNSCVPAVEIILKPSSLNALAVSTIAALSGSATVIRTVPSEGSGCWVASQTKLSAPQMRFYAPCAALRVRFCTGIKGGITFFDFKPGCLHAKIKMILSLISENNRGIL